MGPSIIRIDKWSRKKAEWEKFVELRLDTAEPKKTHEVLTLLKDISYPNLYKIYCV